MLRVETFIKEESGINYFIKFNIDISKEEFIKSINNRFNTNFPLTAKLLKFPCGENMFFMKLMMYTEDTIEELFEYMEDMGVN